MTMAARGPTKPEAGVIATRPATAPLAKLSDAGLPVLQLRNIHVSAAAAVAVFVTTNALAARPFAATALPALNPNQPNHRNTAPNKCQRYVAGLH